MTFTQFCRRIALKLTRGQWVLAVVVFDGVQPGMLTGKDREIALEMFGDVVILPEHRDLVVLRLGRGSGKSTLVAAHGIFRMLTADLSSVGPGDIPTVMVIAPDLDAANDTLSKAVALVENSDELNDRLTRNVARGFCLLNDDGREVRFQSIAKSAQGKAGRGKSVIEAIIDESEFVAPSDPSKRITDSDIIRAITPRITEGGRMVLCSTPWPAESETSRQFDDNFEHPKNGLAARATTLVMRDYAPFWVAKIGRERERDFKNAEREYDCIVRSVEGSFFEVETVDAAIRLDIKPGKNRVTSGIDLGFRNDASAHIMTERQLSKVVVTHVSLDVPQQGASLVPTVICSKYARESLEAQSTVMVADSHYIESAREAARPHRIQVVEGPSMMGGDIKEKAWIYTRDLFREGKLLIPNDPRLLAQLKSIVAVPQSGGGLRIVAPRRQGSGHCDLVSALVNAVWIDRRFGPVISPMKSGEDMPFVVKRANDSFFNEGRTFG